MLHGDCGEESTALDVCARGGGWVRWNFIHKQPFLFFFTFF